VLLLDYVQHVNSSAQWQQGFGMDGHGLGVDIYPPAPDPPQRSYHASALYDGSSAVTATQKGHYGRNPETQQYQHTHPVHGEQQPVRAAGTLTDPVPGVSHDTGPIKIRLNIMWDATTINVWLDTAGPGEGFFRAFQKEVGKRRTIPDRSMIAIIMKNDKNMPEDLSYRLPLDEDSLDADWDTIKEWLDSNKRDKSPHIYGRVEIGEG
jgi:hypothetical protein